MTTVLCPHGAREHQQKDVEGQHHDRNHWAPRARIEVNPFPLQ
jgi:hypothetical protein